MLGAISQRMRNRAQVFGSGEIFLVWSICWSGRLLWWLLSACCKVHRLLPWSDELFPLPHAVMLSACCRVCTDSGPEWWQLSPLPLVVTVSDETDLSDTVKDWNDLAFFSRILKIFRMVTMVLNRNTKFLTFSSS